MFPFYDDIEERPLRRSLVKTDDVIPYRGRSVTVPLPLRSKISREKLDAVAPITESDMHMLGYQQNPPTDVRQRIAARIAEAQRLKYGRHMEEE